MKLLAGECDYDCVNLEGLRCGCGEHQIPKDRINVVHWRNKHWRASCAFLKLYEQTGEADVHLTYQGFDMLLDSVWRTAQTQRK